MGVWTGLVAFGLVACHSCGSRTDLHVQPMKLAFPCDDAGATLANDPNNCGVCGTLCGSYGRNAGGSISFLQGTCSYGACAPYIVSVPAIPNADCWDMGIGWVFSLQGQNAQCVNLLNDNQNCGGVGWTCSNFCQDGICNGFLTIVPPPVLTITVLNPNIPNYILGCTGGAPPCAFTYGVQGNNSNGTISGPSHNIYTPGQRQSTDALRAIDSRGVETITTFIVFIP